MLVHPTLDELLEKIDNKFKLVTLAMKRARELNEGHPPLLHSETRKPVSLALEEIAAGLVDAVEPGAEPGRPEIDEEAASEEIPPDPEGEES